MGVLQWVCVGRALILTQHMKPLQDPNKNNKTRKAKITQLKTFNGQLSSAGKILKLSKVPKTQK